MVLALVAYYQRRMDRSFFALAASYGGACVYALSAAPASVVALGQSVATLLNTGALLPQLYQNLRRRSPGGYSPLTAGLACAGCSVRLFTTIALAGSDPLLLAGFAFGLAVNGLLLAQICWFGMVVEGKPLSALLTADFAAPAPAAPTTQLTRVFEMSDSEPDDWEPMR